MAGSMKPRWQRLTPSIAVAQKRLILIYRRWPSLFAISAAFIASTIVGATSVEQLKNSLGAADMTLSDEVLKDIDEVYRRFPITLLKTSMNQSEIVELMEVLPEIDAGAEVRRQVNFIKHQLELSGFANLSCSVSAVALIPALVASLAQLAVEELNQNHIEDEYRFIAVRLPYDTQADEADAQLSVKFINPSVAVTVNVRDGVDAIHATTIHALEAAGIGGQSDTQQDFVKGNVKARARMVAQYEIAGLMNDMVLGTDHSAGENITGFYTKYGDGAYGLVPLFGLSKRQVRQLAAHMGAPDKIVTKTPTADLETLNPSLPDEEALGLTYDQIDDFLEGKKIDPEAEKKLIHIFSHHPAQAGADRHGLRPVN